MKHNLTIGWMYPDLMSTYGDRGNLLVLEKRCLWRGIKAEIKKIDTKSSDQDLQSCDLLVMGGAQDTQQEIIAKDLIKKKKILKRMIENYTPGLFICGGFQYLGNHYITADNVKLQQLGLLDMHTVNPGTKRLIGNIIIKNNTLFEKAELLIGFENHGGRTILGKNIKPLGQVIQGFGSNDLAQEEGAIYKNIIGSYFHGPILPKNPKLADYLIQKALEHKYMTTISLTNLDDSLEELARKTVAKKLKLAI